MPRRKSSTSPCDACEPTAGDRSDPFRFWNSFSGNIIITGNGVTTTNYLDPGAATNTPANFYHVHLVP
jgi:hypothetical protein